MGTVKNKPALLVIDMQHGIDNPAHGERNNPWAEKNVALMLQAWRVHALPVVHIKHNSTEPDSLLRPELPTNAYKPEAVPLADEPQFSKTVNSAFIGTELESYLRDRSIKALVLVGLTTDHCVSTTARMAANLGFSVTLISDATVTFERTGHDGKHYTADEIHCINLATLHGEFCEVMSTQGAIAQL